MKQIKAVVKEYRKSRLSITISEYLTTQRSMYIWEKRYNTVMLYRYPKSKKYPYEIPTKIRFCGLAPTIQTPLCQIVVWCNVLILVVEIRRFCPDSICCVEFNGIVLSFCCQCKYLYWNNTRWLYFIAEKYYSLPHSPYHQYHKSSYPS